MQVISIVAVKGGVGKTTTAHLLIEGLRQRKYKVLAIDLDQQGNLSMNYEQGQGATAFELMQGADIKLCISNDMVFSSMSLSGIEGKMKPLGAEYVLSEALLEVKNIYDYVVIDTPPGTYSKLHINAYVASDYVIVPVNPDPYNVQSLSDTIGIVKSVNKYYNGHIKNSFVLLNKYKDKKFFVAMKEQMEELLNDGVRIMNTTIPDDAKITEAIGYGETVFSYKAASRGAMAYSSFVDELLSSVEKSYNLSILKEETKEVYRLIEKMKLSDFISEINKLYQNPKNLEAQNFIDALEDVSPAKIKVAILFTCHRKQSIQSINYYKKILVTDESNKELDAWNLFKKLFNNKERTLTNEGIKEESSK